MRFDRGRLVAAAVAAAALSVSFLACGGGQPAQEASPAATTAAKTASPADRVAWYQECWGYFDNKAWDQFRTCYADTAQSDEVGSGRPMAMGLDAIVAGAKQFTDAFPDAKGSGQLILVNGDSLASIYLVSGTQTGPLAGPDGKAIPATGKSIGLYQGHLIQVDPASGKVVKEAFYSDSGTMMAQLGLSPGPARPVATSTMAAPTVAIASGSAAEQANLTGFRAQVDAFNTHDVAAMDAFAAPDILIRELPSPKDMTRTESAESTREMFAAFPDAKLTLSSSWAAGDYVVAAGRFEGTNTGPMPMMGIKQPTGKTARVDYLEITKWDGGKVKEDWLFYNGMAFAEQLGLVAK